MITDLSYLREMSGGNKELVLEMISIFKSQVEEFAVEMKNLFGRGEFELLGKLAHKAKSSVSIMGMEELAKDLKTLELLAREGINPERYPAIIKHFIEATAAASEELTVVEKNIEMYL